MFRVIEKLHKKPEYTRRQVAFGLSAAITSVIFLIWLSVLIYAPSEEKIAVSSDSPLTPLASIRAIALEGLQNLQKEFSDFKKKFDFFSDEYRQGAESTIPDSSIKIPADSQAFE